MGYTLKLVGFGLTAFVAVTLGTAAGNVLSRPAAPKGHRLDPASMCVDQGNLWFPEPPTEGPYKGMRCVPVSEQEKARLRKAAQQTP